MDDLRGIPRIMMMRNGGRLVIILDCGGGEEKATYGVVVLVTGGHSARVRSETDGVDAFRISGEAEVGPG